MRQVEHVENSTVLDEADTGSLVDDAERCLEEADERWKEEQLCTDCLNQ